MLNIYRRIDGRLVPVDSGPVPEDAIWLDLIDPTDDERELVTAGSQHELPE